MPTLADFEALRVEMDAETNRIADKLDELIAKQQAGGLTADEEAAVQAGFAAIRDRLRALGADPENSIPPEA